MAAVTSTAGRKALAKKGQTAYGTSYPVPNVAYLKKALKAVGRVAPGKRGKLASFLRKRARQLGATNVIKGSWADNSGGKKQMCNAMRSALLEFGMDPKQVASEVYEFGSTIDSRGQAIELAGYAEPKSPAAKKMAQDSGYADDPLYKKTYDAMIKRPGMTETKACMMAAAACKLRDRNKKSSSGKATAA